MKEHSVKKKLHFEDFHLLQIEEKVLYFPIKNSNLILP